MESYLPDMWIPTEENIDTRFLIIIDLVTPNGTFPIAENNDPRSQSTVYLVALCESRVTQGKNSESNQNPHLQYPYTLSCKHTCRVQWGKKPQERAQRGSTYDNDGVGSFSNIQTCLSIRVDVVFCDEALSREAQEDT